MKIVVHDTVTAMDELLRLPQDERLEALRRLYAPVQKVVSKVAPVDLAQNHQTAGGFRIDGDDSRYLDAIRQLRDRDTLGDIETTLNAARDHLLAAAPAARSADTVHVVLALGDPDDHLFTVTNSGYLGFGGFPGAIQLFIWPNETSLAKIGYAAAHELHHNIRYSNVTWNPMTVTLGEQVVAEGLAEAFVRELAGPEAMGPWATTLTGDGLDAAYATLVAAIDTTGMENFPPYVHGDDTARYLGLKPAGLPNFAGYAVGLRIVDAHTSATGLTPAASVALPASEVLSNAGIATGT
ncbi:MAG TPA: DUF2268 domain-containing putative Zn-dependent protease [Stackebrandtia sp.]|jgi:uncharacterized protein YjaZ|uniref:DUF2268 domain-containing protein n=1 Tax=Stackebrandtia sp. TaxID=2023065 RepID=UPI002D51E771|nr:DUF2268 domain-containing putative Zn-dependent protease [Stackebrandtia sp.]HZE37381.1 DUF2268 domain-containing putative Zn-dependent protease [Stackebrandtia sp.]